MTVTTQFYGTGRRKTAAARVFLRPGSGQIEVNGRDLETYFPNDIHKMIIKQPLALTETGDKFDLFVTVEGAARPGRPAPSATASRVPSWSTTGSCAIG